MSTTNWEYRVTSIAASELSTATPGATAAVAHLNAHGMQGWEAVGLTTLAGGECAILMKRELAKARASGGRV
ncbi:hypothetical protein N8Z08_01440 [bacterium]|jgi:hypothetical protein|nr:hypothetical protein [Acidimicrobiaceae bacterium]MCH9802655.1 hypothetical protein [bacterium]MDG1088722.1 hypothetical protein [Acidimicrobiales bacterium]MBT6444878.1 hypothetical protein [Acidimicrobiaceae bacterium]MCO4832549.1 hypothetical protein [Acidimicrobiaceae bacterium]